MTSHLLRLWVIGSYEMPRCDWLQHCNFLAGIEILPIALQTACKPCGFAAGRPAIVAGPVLRVAIGESCSVCRAPKASTSRAADSVFQPRLGQKALARLSRTSHLQLGIRVGNMPDSWRYKGSVLGLVDQVSVYCDGTYNCLGRAVPLSK